MRTFALLLAVQLLAAAGLAQNTAEFGRASGGSIDAITKGSRHTSGSLALRQSTGLFGGRGYEATLGGELVQDRLWFFGAASRSRFSTVNMTAQPVDGTNVSASALPESFLSLRSTSMFSDRMMVNFSFTMTRPQ